MGQVRYINFDRDLIGMGNRLNYIVHKRMSYEHEKEVRAVIWSPKQEPQTRFTVVGDGFVVPVELHELIQEVYVSPSSLPPIKDVVESLVTDYGLTVRVLQSEVNAPPSF
jgi:hypothetical protein